MYENKNEQFQKSIRILMEQTKDAYILCCIYTIAICHLQSAVKKGGAI